MKHKDIVFTIGADPELFCYDTSINNYIAVQNCGIKGTKESPQKLSCGGNVQRDNVAIEFGIIPAFTKEDFMNNIKDTLQDVVNVLPEHVELVLESSAMFPENQLIHDECKQFGCDPDRNAWTMQENEPPPNADKGVLRSCGGHIHIGYVENSGLDFLLDYELQIRFIRVLDMLLGIPSTQIDKTDGKKARRELYGMPGCYRQTPYGVEYRTLSNFWIHSPQHVFLIYELVKDALKVMKEGKDIQLLEICKKYSRMSQVTDVRNLIIDPSYYNYERSEVIYFLYTEVMSEDSKIHWNKIEKDYPHYFAPYMYENWNLGGK